MSQITDSLIYRANREATLAPVSEVASVLQELLSRRLTAYIAGVREGKTVSRWASGEVDVIRDYTVEQRLRVAYEIVQLLMANDSAKTVKAWFIGLNPQLDDISPAEAIHDGRLKDALAAARAFSVGG